MVKNIKVDKSRRILRSTSTFKGIGSKRSANKVDNESVGLNILPASKDVTTLIFILFLCVPLLSKNLSLEPGQILQFCLFLMPHFPNCHKDAREFNKTLKIMKHLT